MFTLCPRNSGGLIAVSVLLLLFATVVVGEDAGKTMESHQRLLRLPNTTYPLRYNLHIVTHIHRQIFGFTGNVTMDILVKESTDEIILHAKNLSVLILTVVEHSTGDVLEDIVYSYNKAASFLVIHPREKYQAFESGQKLRVEIHYSGILSNDTIGLYQLSYNDLNNKTVYLAATQFEPTGARYVFPCYDEPAFKSSFTIRITHGSNYTAISNMHVDGDPVLSAGDMMTTTFHETPPMSTYLVAIVVSNFGHISEEYRGITQRVFAAPNCVNKGHKELRNAVRTVTALEDYFGIQYPLSKLDHIALQKVHGTAMENWGLITYREDDLLNNDDTDVKEKLKGLLTQSHEIAHQWFGNLVSPEWWTYAWMNEGFAVYFGYLITDMIYPEYKVMENFLTDIAERSYSYIMSRPMTQYVEKDTEIIAIFDFITYMRAACVIKMFHHAFNQATFVRGLNKFLDKYQYKTANENQLFEALQQAVHEDKSLNKWHRKLNVTDIMISWTHNEEIPIITVTTNYDQNTITIRQRPRNINSKELWWIPLNFATTSQSDFEDTHADYIMPPEAEVTLQTADLGFQLEPSEWLIVNKQRTGLYHVLYDDANLLAIAKQLQQDHTTIHELNRAAIFQDLCPLVESNEISSVGVVFDLLKYLQREQNVIPWYYVADVVAFFSRNLYNTRTHELYKEFIQRLVTPMFRQLKQLPQTNITSTAISAREKVIDIACNADLIECLEFTRELAHDYIFQQVQLHTGRDSIGMQDSILCMGVKYLSDNEFDAILEWLKRSERLSPQHQDLIYSMRCTQSRSHMQQFLQLLMEGNSTRKFMTDDDLMLYLLFVCQSNLKACPEVWTFLENNYKTLCRSRAFTEGFNRIAEYVSSSQRQQFRTIHQKIVDEMRVVKSDKHSNDILIDDNSSRIGKKVKHSEKFLTQFEDDIHDWLSREHSQYVATIGARNQASRLGSSLKLPERVYKKLLIMQS